MNPIYISYLPELTEAGATANRSGIYPIESYKLGDSVFTFDSKPTYDLNLSHTGEGILVEGTVNGVARGLCDRCLAATVREMQSPVDAYYLFDIPEDIDDEDGDDYEFTRPDNTIDISNALSTALIMDTPFVNLCSEDCKGICLECGANMNTDPCDCASKKKIDPLNPFAKLAELKFDEDENDN